MTFHEYKQKFSISLTAQQEEAVLRADGKTLLLAVPGSGKTTVTVARLGYLIHCMGVPTSQLLTLTYSVASCRDMKSRYIKVFGEENVPEFRTINGICSIIIRHFERTTGRCAFRLSESERDSTDVIARLYHSILGEYPSPNDLRDIKSKITYVRNMLMTPKEIKAMRDVPDGFSDILDGFRRYKHENKIMDYDDQLEYAYIILRQYPDILSYFSDRFRYVSVDEAQDTSKLQHEIIKLLARKNGNIFMVGDEDQSIYGFRAAYPRALLDFEKTYPDAKVMFIEQNFRSTGEIVNSAKRLISNNTERRKKNMHTEKPQGGKIKTVVLSDYSEQASALLSDCRNALCSGETTAILFRNNESALPIINLLQKNGIPYACRENDALFFTGRAVSDMIKLLSFCNDPENTDALLELVPRLGCGLTSETRQKLQRAVYESAGNGLLDLVCREAENSGRGSKAQELRTVLCAQRDKSAYSAINTLYGETCFGRFLEKRCGDTQKLSVLLAIAKDCGGIGEFLERIDFLSECVKNHENPKGNCPVLSTVHSSKGLEFDNVIIIDARNGIFPAEAPTLFMSAEKRAALEEERRLFYVALTRAKKSVKIYVCRNEFSAPCEESLFLGEISDVSAKNTSSIPVRKRTIGKTAWTPVDLSAYKVGTRVLLGDNGSGVIKSLDGDIAKIKCGKETRTFNLTLGVKSNFIRLGKQ